MAILSESDRQRIENAARAAWESHIASELSPQSVVLSTAEDMVVVVVVGFAAVNVTREVRLTLSRVNFRVDVSSLGDEHVRLEVESLTIQNPWPHDAAYQALLRRQINERLRRSVVQS